MFIADVPGAEQRVVMRAEARITPKYTVEVTLYDFSDSNGAYATEFVWAPHKPSPAKMKRLSNRIDAALRPFLVEALRRSGRLKEGAA